VEAKQHKERMSLLVGSVLDEHCALCFESAILAFPVNILYMYKPCRHLDSGGEEQKAEPCVDQNTTYICKNHHRRLPSRTSSQDVYGGGTLSEAPCSLQTESSSSMSVTTLGLPLSTPSI